MNTPASTRKTIVFLIRAYNDLDIQMSLIHEFSADPSYAVKVIGYPCDGTLYDVSTHEAVPYMRDHFSNLEFKTVLDYATAPLLLRGLYKLERGLYAMQKQSGPLQPLFKILRYPCLKYLKASFHRTMHWLDPVFKEWNANIYHLDEVIVQQGRSDVLDRILPETTKNGVARIFCTMTGQYIYKCENPGGTKFQINYIPHQSKLFFVAHNHDIKMYSHQYPDENYCVTGNLRMNKPWIETLHGRVLTEPYFPYQTYKNRLPNTQKPKICFMLSKMNYGIEADKLIETIRAVCNRDDCAVAIKPHTRGMKFDFMDPSLVGDATIADQIPSAVLCDWADIILFTGSGIVFHAMVLGKAAGFLTYCQDHETIFDDGAATRNFKDLDDLMTYVDAFNPDQDNATAPKDWIKDRLCAGREDCNNAAFVKEKIESCL